MSTTEQVARAAYEKLRAGDLAGAEALLAPAVARDPNNPNALQLMGIICQQQGRPRDAARYLRQCVKAQPRNAQLQNNLGVVLQACGEVEEAIGAFRAAMAADPNFVPARVGLVLSLIEQGDGEQAAHEAATLTKLDQNPQAWELLSNAERSAGRFDAALAAADRAIQMAPNVASFHHTRALALQQLGRNGEALAQWEMLARGGVRSPELSGFHARALSTEGRAQEAASVMRQALAQWPLDPSVHSVWARLKWMDGAHDSFTDEIEAAIRQSPRESALRAEAAMLLSQAGHLDRAEALIREGLKLAPQDPVLVRSLSTNLAEQGRLEEAFAVIEAHPLPAFAGDRAALLLRLGRGEEALRALRALPRRASEGEKLVALEAMAMKLSGDPGFEKLYDYDRYVRTFDVEPPFGTTVDFNAELAKRLRRLHDSVQHPLEQTLRNGTQTSRDLRHVDDPVVQAFIAALDKPIRAYIAGLSPDDALGVRRRENYRITGFWSVRLKPGGFHINHVHDRGWISSAYYVDLPPDTVRGDTQGGCIKFGEAPWPLPGVTPGKIVQPRVGMLVLFPSYMLHGTIPFAEGEERLTAAFDVVPQ